MHAELQTDRLLFSSEVSWQFPSDLSPRERGLKFKVCFSEAAEVRRLARKANLKVSILLVHQHISVAALGMWSFRRETSGGWLSARKDLQLHLSITRVTDVGKF